MPEGHSLMGGVFLGLATGLLVAFFLWCESLRLTHVIEDDRSRAVKAGVGRYVFNAATGKSEFRYGKE